MKNITKACLGFGIFIFSHASFPLPSAPSAKPVKLVVGFAAGGAIDTLARTLASRLTHKLERPVYVENRVGAGGSIAAAYVAQSSPDGNTILLASPGEIFVNRIFYKHLNVDGLKNLVPVSKISTTPIVLATNSQSNIKQVDDIFTEVKKRPLGLNFASSGTGSSQHLVGEIFKKQMGIDMAHIPYNGGSSAAASLLGNQVDLLFAGLSPIAPFLKGNRLRVIAVTSEKRSPLIPEVPTLRETGLGDFHLEYWQGIFLPRNTPGKMVSALSQELSEVLGDPQFSKFLQELGYTTAFKGCDEFRDFLTQEEKKYSLAEKTIQLAQ
ncbi:Bug family tripartite tricarboxylate transporter substrate binding protein [Comamonas humi]